MNRNTGGQQWETHGLETDAARDPRDGGCPNCGRPTTAVPLTDFGFERGQLCPHCGLVNAARPVATDGGTEPDAVADRRCECRSDDDLECWHCFRAADRGLDRDADRVELERQENERLAKAEERTERALERGDWGVGVGGGRR